MRVKASSIGLNAEEYLHELATDEWSGIAEVSLSGDDMANLYDNEELVHDSAKELPMNTGLGPGFLREEAPLGRVSENRTIRLVKGDRDLFGLHGRSAEQRLAIDSLLDPAMGIVSLGGTRGTQGRAL